MSSVYYNEPIDGYLWWAKPLTTHILNKGYNTHNTNRIKISLLACTPSRNELGLDNDWALYF